MSYENLPPELKCRPQWVCWRREERSYGMTKVPYNPATGRHAATNDPDTWVEFEVAVASSKWYDGIGYVFSQHDPFIGIDIDKCVFNDVPIPDVVNIIADFGSYAELSPSHTGVHILVEAMIPGGGGRKANGFEMYGYGRFFTCTGENWDGYPHIVPAQAQVDFYYTKWFGEVRQELPAVILESRMEDELVLRRASTAKNGAEFTRLWNGDWQGRYGSQSEADSALCMRLSFWSGDPEQMDRMFRQSGLMRPKWDEFRGEHTYYGQMTIQRVLQANPERFQVKEIETVSRLREEIDLTSYPPDDAGNAEAVWAMVKDEFRFVPQWGWLFHTGTHWEKEGALQVLVEKVTNALRIRRAQAVLKGREAVVKVSNPMSGKVNAAIFFLQSHARARVSDFNNVPHLLNCLNGVVDLSTGKLYPHNDVDALFTYVTPTRYVPGSDYTEFREWLIGIVEGGAEVVDYMQEAIGYSFTGETREECFWYLYGATRSGKGTLTETLGHVLGKSMAVEIGFDTFVESSHSDAQNFALAPLQSVRLVFASEPSESDRINTKKMKHITGGNDIRCAFKGKDHFEYHPQFKIWLTANPEPNSNPDDAAFWGRIRVIHFPKSRLGEEDKHLKDRMADVKMREGILAWAIEGAVRWYNRYEGLITPEAVTLQGQMTRNLVDIVKQWLEENTEAEAEGFASLGAVRLNYELWCKVGGHNPLSGKAFAKSMRAKGFQPDGLRRVDGKTFRVWQGFKLSK